MTFQEKRSLIRLLGIVLFTYGIYIFAHNISFVGECNSYFCYQWKSFLSISSVIASMGGILSLFAFKGQAGNWGWVLLGIGFALVYLSGGLILSPSGMLKFLASFMAMSYGDYLIKRGRINF